MCFDWRNGFGAATGSLIITVRQFEEDRIQAMPWLARVARWDVILGTSSVLALTLYYRHRERPFLVQEGIRLVMVSLRMLSRQLAGLYLILVQGDTRYYARIYSGFFVTYLIILFQGMNLCRWQNAGIESAFNEIRVIYVSTVIIELIAFYPFRLRELGPRDYLVRTFLSILNILGLFISFRSDMWERIYILFVVSSLTALSMRYFDMVRPLNLVEGDRQDDGIPPLVAIEPNQAQPALGPNHLGIRIPNGHLGSNAFFEVLRRHLREEDEDN